jgi:hypothetical protein
LLDFQEICPPLPSNGNRSISTCFSGFYTEEANEMRKTVVRRKVVFSVVACLAAAVALPAAAADKEGKVRDLFRDYFKKDAQGNQLVSAEELAQATGQSEKIEHVIALEYEILALNPDGTQEPVDPDSHEFKIGDRIRVKIQPLHEAYIYIYHEGASGEQLCLLPTKQEKAPAVKANVPVELPGDGYFEFVPPPGDEKLLVVATEEPVAELALLKNVVFGKEDLTPEEQQIKSRLKSKFETTLKSIRDRQDRTNKFRGLMTPEEIAKFSQKVAKTRGVGSTMVEPAHEGESANFAVRIGTKADESPKLLINIPLRSRQ